MLFSVRGKKKVEQGSLFDQRKYAFIGYDDFICLHQSHLAIQANLHQSMPHIQQNLFNFPSHSFSIVPTSQAAQKTLSLIVLPFVQLKETTSQIAAPLVTPTSIIARPNPVRLSDRRVCPINLETILEFNSLSIICTERSRSDDVIVYYRNPQGNLYNVLLFVDR